MIKIDSNQENKVVIASQGGQGQHLDVYKFSQSVLKELSKDNIPSIPSNYSIYFEKLLDKGPDEFKKKIGDVISNTEPVGAHNASSINLEKEVKQSYMQIKSMLQTVALIYKNLSTMKQITQRHAQTLQASTDILAVRKVVDGLGADLGKLTALMDKHIDLIKLSYEEVSRVFKSVEEQAVYDSYYDIYNKKFLLTTMASEAESVKRYGYKSSFLLVKIHDKILKRITSIKDREGIQRLVAQMLLKTSRRSDVVAHYGDGRFAMVMKHTDLEGARKACERILALLYEQDYTTNGEVIDIEFQMVGSELNSDGIVEQHLATALDRLLSSTKAEQPVMIQE